MRNKTKGIAPWYKTAMCIIFTILALRVLPVYAVADNPVDTESGNKTEVMYIVKGNVVDENNEPIIGCTIVDVNAATNAVSDINGNFSIKVGKGSAIRISYLGYKEKIVKIENNDKFNIRLEVDTHNLSEVVAIGYGSTTVKSSTGSITQIKSDDLNRNVTTNFANSLSGKVTGVQVIQPSGQPGTDSEIRVRGIGTLTAGGAPLIVVDGMPLSEGTTLNSINTASIESIEILKDAASTAIYGSRGANGIIMVKTKGGDSTKPKVALSASMGIQQRSDKVKLVNAYDFATFLKEARNTGYVNKDPKNRNESDTNEERIKKGASKRQLIPDYIVPYLNGEKGLTDTDWYDEIFRNASVQDYNLSINGGSNKFKYSFTGGYMKQDGIVLKTGFEKYSANVNLQFQPSDHITIGTSLFPSYSKQNLTQSRDVWGGTLMSAASISYPFFSPYNEDGSFAISKQINANIVPDGALQENPVAWAHMLDNKKTNARFFGNLFTEITFFKGLKYKLNIGTDYESIKHTSFKPSDIGQYRAAAPSPAYAENNKGEKLNYLIENTLYFNRYFGKDLEHYASALIGQSYQKESYERIGIMATGFTDNSIRNIAGGSGFKITPAQYEWNLISYFGRINYLFRERYILNVSARWDGSSRFGSNSKWGFFPAVSTAWVITNEPFMKNIGLIDYAKLRLSWGKSGNNQIPNYGSLAMMKRSDYIFDGNLASGSLIGTSPNPSLSWEKTSTINAGLNVVMGNYLGIDFDFYSATTNDLLLDVPVPEQSGYQSSLQNIGKVRNIGVELKLYTASSVKFGNAEWNLTFTMSTNKDKVLALAPGQTQIISGNNITRVGKSIGELYGYEVIGLYKTQADLDRYPHMAGTQLGDPIIKDLSDDKEITTEDKRSFGSPAAKVILGFNNAFKYKGFGLSFDLYSELGKKKYNGTLASLESGEGFMMITQNYFDKRWHPQDSPNGTMFTPNMGNYSNTRKQALNSNIFFVNASYLQLRSLRLSYDMPAKLLKKIGVENAEVYLMGNNLLMITPYKGFNVEAENNSSVLRQGFEKYSYPMPRTYTIGINVTF